METKTEIQREKEKKLHIEALRQMLTLATSGFGLVAALAWNSVIQEFVKKVIPQGRALASLLIYAVLVTLLAVTVTLQLSKFIQKLEHT